MQRAVWASGMSMSHPNLRLKGSTSYSPLNFERKTNFQQSIHNTQIFSESFLLLLVKIFSIIRYICTFFTLELPLSIHNCNRVHWVAFAVVAICQPAGNRFLICSVTAGSATLDISVSVPASLFDCGSSGGYTPPEAPTGISPSGTLSRPSLAAKIHNHTDYQYFIWPVTNQKSDQICRKNHKINQDE